MIVINVLLAFLCMHLCLYFQINKFISLGISINYKYYLSDYRGDFKFAVVRKRSKILLHEGYQYTMKRKLKLSTHWRCRYWRKKCYGKIIIRDDTTFTITTPHVCEPDLTPDTTTKERKENQK